jgi:hypothetical protein
MFSHEITSTDAFLDMPTSSQLLYFHLGMNADDDGFIANPKMVMRVIGASGDDLKLLEAKKFILTFPNGVCVVKHWRINNYIRKDIYKETKYIDEKSSLFIRENGSYSFNPECALPVPKGHFTVKETDFVDDTSTERAHRLGKVRLGKVSIDTSTDTFEQFWQNYPKKVGKSKALKEWQKLKPTSELVNQIISHLQKRVKTTWVKENKRFVVHPERFIRDCRWEDELEPADKGIALKTNSGMADKIKAKHNL